MNSLAQILEPVNWENLLWRQDNPVGGDRIETWQTKLGFWSDEMDHYLHEVKRITADTGLPITEIAIQKMRGDVQIADERPDEKQPVIPCPGVTLFNFHMFRCLAYIKFGLGMSLAEVDWSSIPVLGMTYQDRRTKAQQDEIVGGIGDELEAQAPDASLAALQSVCRWLWELGLELDSNIKAVEQLTEAGKIELPEAQEQSDITVANARRLGVGLIWIYLKFNDAFGKI